MEVSVNLWAILLAALSTMVVGSLWYGKTGFGNQWMKLAGIKPDAHFTTEKAAYLYGGALLVSLVTAFVLAYFTAVTAEATNSEFLPTALKVGVLAWLGFTAVRIHMHDAFEGRRKKLTLLNVAHEFVTILVMSLIIGLIG